MASAPCLFCNLPRERIVHQNDLAIAILDAFPVTVGHALLIPRRHVETYFELEPLEVVACHEMMVALRELSVADDPSITGFNIGMNAGNSAGQTIFHCHIHLIPRRNGDVPNPRGGIRHVIPGKGYY